MTGTGTFPRFDLDALPELPAAVPAPTIEMGWNDRGYLHTRFKVNDDTFNVWTNPDGPADDLYTWGDDPTQFFVALTPPEQAAFRNWAHHVHERIRTRAREAFFRMATPDVQATIVASAL
jgi:hypothetical protein